MKQFKTNIRLERVKQELSKRHLDAVLVSSIPNIIYLTNFSHFSNVEREAFLLITQSEQYIITDGRYSEAIALHIPHFTLIERTTTNSLSKIFKRFAKKHGIKKLGIEEDNISVREQKLLAECFNDLPAGRQGLNHFSISPLRAVKDDHEVKAIEKACLLGDKAFAFILSKIKKGTTEKEIAFQLELFIKKHGAELSFPTIVAFGKNSSVPHHQTSDQRLKTNDIVLLDFGVKLNNYCSDMTRTVFFGKPTDEQKKMYNTVLEAQQKAIEYLSRCHSDEGQNLERSEIPNQVRDDIGIKASDIDRVARSCIEQQGYPTIPHSLGHGTGLEVHESPRLGPRSKDTLKVGMVFSIEPGIYLKGVGGVRIEDLVVIEEAGLRLLCKSPKHLTTL